MSLILHFSRCTLAKAAFRPLARTAKETDFLGLDGAITVLCGTFVPSVDFWIGFSFVPSLLNGLTVLLV